jgi:hypothetical protein
MPPVSPAARSTQATPRTLRPRPLAAPAPSATYALTAPTAANVQPVAAIDRP